MPKLLLVVPDSISRTCEWVLGGWISVHAPIIVAISWPK